MNFLNRFRTGKTVFFHDILMAPIAWFGAYWLRFNLEMVPEEALTAAVSYLPVVLIVQAAASRFFGLYRGVWLFASIPDLLRIIKSVLAAALIIAVVLFLLNRLEGVPRSVIPLYSVLLILLLSAPRFLYRFWKDGYAVKRGNGKRALIVGAGSAGDMLVRDLLRESNAEYHPVIFVDDDPGKQRREIRGIRVAGSVRKIPRLISRYDIDAVLIAIPSADDKEMQKVVEICEAAKIPFLTLPSVNEILSGKVTRQALREVSINDLLGRAPVELDWKSIHQKLSGHKLLVSGGGGSIGSELCRQLAQIEVDQLIIFEKSEFNLYRIESELRAHYPALSLAPVLGDVADRAAVKQVMNRYRPDVVFHAAAYKHVPLLEEQEREAAHNNVVGSRNIAMAAIESGAEEFVLISTDKAVNPTNVMGTTKRIAEIICQSLNGSSKTRFITVRFGNVLGSAGSVIPLFKEQIRNGGPVTVTHPDITRYFMTIPEASQLIMQAAAVGEGGEIFVLDMGEPVKISYLAEQMIRLSGKQPGKDIQIEYIGLRPGEKMYEELFHEQEPLSETGHNKLLLSGSRAIEQGFLEKQLGLLEQACQQFDGEQIRVILRNLVPEFQSKVSNIATTSISTGQGQDRRKFVRNYD